ncbi:MAG: hypothetical protein Q4B70_07830 [Lachnospiraceae bacterium]|nr:hypothetical protein [Lachnospiraceae bacterium]
MKKIKYLGYTIVALILIYGCCFILYGRKTNYFKADRMFFRVSANKICGGMQKELEEAYVDYYTDLYLSKLGDKEYLYEKATTDEIMDIFLQIEDTVFYYDQAEWSSEYNGLIQCLIPVTTMNQDYVVYLSGARTCIGTYAFSRMSLKTKAEDAYYKEAEVNINSKALFENGIDSQYHYTAFKDITIKDSGQTIPAGTYYLDGDSSKDYLVVDENRMVKDSRNLEAAPDYVEYYKAVYYKNGENEMTYFVFTASLTKDFYDWYQYQLKDDHTLVSLSTGEVYIRA